jgi:hypothetical protein
VAKLRVVLAGVLAVALSACGVPGGGGPGDPPLVAVSEVEPNDTPATATPVASLNFVLTGTLVEGETDYFLVANPAELQGQLTLRCTPVPPPSFPWAAHLTDGSSCKPNESAAVNNFVPPGTSFLVIVNAGSDPTPGTQEEAYTVTGTYTPFG